MKRDTYQSKVLQRKKLLLTIMLTCLLRSDSNKAFVLRLEENTFKSPKQKTERQASSKGRLYWTVMIPLTEHGLSSLFLFQ